MLKRLKDMYARLYQTVYRLREGITLSNAAFELTVSKVNTLADSVSVLSDTELRDRFDRVRTQVANGNSRNGINVEGLSIIREAAGRTVSMRPYEVQMLAASALLAGKCVEMQTGEGKTLVAAVAACLRAPSSKNVHVLTFNDYLARRDARWMEPLYRFFGLSVGYVIQGMSREDRQAAYRCDITYATAKEAAFDYLRDQLCQKLEHRVHCGFHAAIIDEADSILIDEARIPLVIATAAERDGANLYDIAKLVRPLRQEIHFEIKASGRNVSLTDKGIELLERQLGIDELHSEEHMSALARINLALQAEVLLTRDIDYIVRDKAIQLVDEFTGRVAENRKWPGGLQAALEAKEGLEIQPQGKILNSITLQQFIEHYPSLCDGHRRRSCRRVWRFL